MMNSRLPLLSLVALAVLAFAGACGAQETVDAVMGDWQGTWTSDAGAQSPLVAQVFPLGGGKYQANLRKAFDTADAPVAVLHGVVFRGKTLFAGAVAEGPMAGTIWAGTVEGNSLTGGCQGEAKGTFALTKKVRLSPTLGAKPPEGAIVLLDGANMDAWVHPHYVPYIINLRKLLGNENNAVAYLSAAIDAPEARDAVLELGSNDGLKVWLNGEVVLAKNASRGCKPGDDKVNLKLSAGRNELLLKVTQYGGGWSTCARLVSPEGGPVAGLEVEPVANATDPAYEGYLLEWQYSGPYSQAGKDAKALFDVAFPPESGGGEWKNLSKPPLDPGCQWQLVEGGAMEVVAGSGSVVSRHPFQDHKLHVEFRTPYMADARGQGRGNSGVYVQARYEVQVLDSYGLEGLDNECGGIYKIARPLVNMCAPPLQWQTYDITFRAARYDAAGKKTENARITVLHNGVAIHDDLELPDATPGGLSGEMPEPGGLLFQDHGNPVQFRNIWAVEGE